MSTDVQIMERKNGRLVDIEFVEDTETRNMSEYFENTSSDLAKDGHRPTVTAVAVVTVVTVAAPGAPLTPKAVDAVALLVFTGFHLGLTQWHKSHGVMASGRASVKAWGGSPKKGGVRLIKRLGVCKL